MLNSAGGLPPHGTHGLPDMRHVQHLVAVAEETASGVVEDREARHHPMGSVFLRPQDLIPLTHQSRTRRDRPVLGCRPSVSRQSGHRFFEERADPLTSLNR
jgi:hypothetical protein